MCVLKCFCVVSSCQPFTGYRDERDGRVIMWNKSEKTRGKLARSEANFGVLCVFHRVKPSRQLEKAECCRLVVYYFVHNYYNFSGLIVARQIKIINSCNIRCASRAYLTVFAPLKGRHNWIKLSWNVRDLNGSRSYCGKQDNYIFGRDLTRKPEMKLSLHWQADAR